MRRRVKTPPPPPPPSEEPEVPEHLAWAKDPPEPEIPEELTEVSPEGKGPKPPGKRLVREIRRGERDPKSLSREERRQCVLWLESKGATKQNIADVLRVDHSTVADDLRAIGEELASAGGFDAVAVMAKVERTADYVMARCLRDADLCEKTARKLAELARDLENANKIAAAVETYGSVAKEYAAAGNLLWKVWRTLRDFVQMLQSTGAIPKAASRMEIDVKVEERVKIVFAVVRDAVLAEVEDPALRERIGKRVAGALEQHLG